VDKGASGGVFYTPQAFRSVSVQARLRLAKQNARRDPEEVCAAKTNTKHGLAGYIGSQLQRVDLAIENLFLQRHPDQSPCRSGGRIPLRACDSNWEATEASGCRPILAWCSTPVTGRQGFPTDNQNPPLTTLNPAL
jgi:hypothetical protein